MGVGGHSHPPPSPRSVQDARRGDEENADREEGYEVYGSIVLCDSSGDLTYTGRGDDVPRAAPDRRAAVPHVVQGRHAGVHAAVVVV